MTDKPIIKLKPMEDLYEKIIKEKGNTKCIFYSDNICRKGDKTRDCVNCARVEYHSLYSLNWDNQERLQKIINEKEQECEELKKIINEAKNSKLDLKSFLVGEAVQNEYEQQLDQLKAEIETLFKAIEEVNKINKRLELENEELKKCYKNNSSLLDFEETNTTKLVNKVMKLEQTLTEIKEIAEKEVNTRMLFADKESFCDFNKILQKISECEVNNAR